MSKLIFIFATVFALRASALTQVNVSGYNGDIDSAAAEDLTPVAVTLPSAAAATTIVSGSANDAAAGTGARTVRVSGLDSAYKAINETATMNGATPVALTNQFYRVNVIDVLTAGSGGVPAGQIDVKHTATVIGSLEAGINRSRVAYWAASLPNRSWKIVGVHGEIWNALAGAAVVNLYTRKAGGVWQIRKSLALHGAGTPGAYRSLEAPIYLEAGEDVKLEGKTSADNGVIGGGLDILGSTTPF